MAMITSKPSAQALPCLEQAQCHSQGLGGTLSCSAEELAAPVVLQRGHGARTGDIHLFLSRDGVPAELASPRLCSRSRWSWARPTRGRAAWPILPSILLTPEYTEPALAPVLPPHSTGG